MDLKHISEQPLQVPQVESDTLPFISNPNIKNPITPEIKQFDDNQTSTPNPFLQSVPQPAVTVLPVSDDTTTQTTSATQQGMSPAIADDVDLIEKEWVTRARQIVDQTKQDPYLQNKEINKVKADYIKKRYNKDIELNED